MRSDEDNNALFDFGRQPVESEGRHVAEWIKARIRDNLLLE